VLAGVTEAAGRIGVACATLHAEDRFPAEGILDAARTHGCDLIVMASHGRRGLTRLLLGSEAVRVPTHSTVPVLICR
jgi:nucleotide-binding universal stress UspA family protein